MATDANTFDRTPLHRIIRQVSMHAYFRKDLRVASAFQVAHAAVRRHPEGLLHPRPISNAMDDGNAERALAENTKSGSQRADSRVERDQPCPSCLSDAEGVGFTPVLLSSDREFGSTVSRFS